jgi:hypothetical protein
MSSILTIENLDRIKGFAVGDDYTIARMYVYKNFYRIHLNNLNGIHARELILERFPINGLYRLTYGNFFIGVSKETISDINLFLDAIDFLITK